MNIRLLVFYFFLILGIVLVAITCDGCASVDGNGGPGIIEIITTDPMDPDGVLQDPIIPKKEEKPDKEPVIESSITPATSLVAGIFVGLRGLEPLTSTMSM